MYGNSVDYVGVGHVCVGDLYHWVSPYLYRERRPTPTHGLCIGIVKLKPCTHNIFLPSNPGTKYVKHRHVAHMQGYISNLLCIHCGWTRFVDGFQLVFKTIATPTLTRKQYMFTSLSQF